MKHTPPISIERDCSAKPSCWDYISNEFNTVRYEWRRLPWSERVPSVIEAAGFIASVGIVAFLVAAIVRAILS